MSGTALKADIKSIKTVFNGINNGFMRIDEFEIEHTTRENGTQTVRKPIFQRGHAVGVLGYDEEHKKVVLISEMRVGVLAAGDYPWTENVVAGGINTRSGETAVGAALREMVEEAGLQLSEPVLVHPGYYAGSDVTSERLALVAGRVDIRAAGGVHGLEEEHENINTIVLSSAEFIRRVRGGEVTDYKTMSLGYWLEDNYPAMAVPDTPAPQAPSQKEMVATVQSATELFRHASGTMSIRRLIIERDRHEGGSQVVNPVVLDQPRAVSAVGYDPKRDEVVLVSKMRPGVLAALAADGVTDSARAWTEDLVYGNLAAGEDAVAGAVRQMKAQTGVDLGSATLSHPGAYVSSGGMSTKVAMVTGVVDATGLGNVSRMVEGEEVTTVVVPYAEFIRRARAGEIEDSKTQVAAYWLKNNRDRLRAEYTTAQKAAPLKGYSV